MAAAFKKFWNRCAERRPLSTISLTNGAMGATGDILAQFLVPETKPTLSNSNTFSTADADTGSNEMSNARQLVATYNPWRTVRFFVYGCMFGPVAYKWYSFLDRRFPFPKPTSMAILSSRKQSQLASKKTSIIKRVSMDQLLFAPPAISAFFVIMGTMEGKSTDEIHASFRERYFKALVGNYILWPAAQLVNFGLVPLVYQVPFASAVSIVWSMYLSWCNRGGQPNPDRHTTLRNGM
ncbi:hypothetical protein GGI25_002628 [Coemansia spiralis]|uniref:Protein SYM1 n=2 Tax=Coemansia TaxID=4863 RepID=A0A9W8KXA9_9FUNG|nr:hypothetical protein EDC05_004434 [Coemansia umbellata]KAJ2620605.1 hypothetical protein GGI26_004837 [Coemansia sp. RSA 1358]KAJ2678124.1 hypothetical protein GGI25_002628 [Coemansia spiralis]